MVIRGVGATNSKLKYNGGGGSTNFITAAGRGLQATTTNIYAGFTQGSYVLQVADATGFSINDYVKIKEADAGRITSTWATNTIGQYNKIIGISGTTITLKDALHTTYYNVNTPTLQHVKMMQAVGVECLYIERLDATTGQTNNILFTYTTNSWINGIQSQNTNFGHVVFDNSYKCQVNDSHFKDAFAYGGGGQAYGVVCQMTTTLCKTENCIFDHLRHSTLIQAGCNGNVYGYNYSKNPYWTSFPSNAAGDVAMHGNYAYANLFEGNIFQNIVIDNSHGINGPNNTLFRNRALLFGIFMNTGAGDSVNIVGNEITSTGFGLGQYTITGTGHYQYGNNKNGTILPTSTTPLNDTTYYLNMPQPPCWQGLAAIPTIGIPNTISTGTNVQQHPTSPSAKPSVIYHSHKQ